MPAATLTAFEPRKTPVQARAEVTVEAICEATIQVLLSHGADQLTTTRVADRAGVSVGTLYQYYPNKQSLLYAVMEEHLDRVATAVEAACEESCHKPLAEMIRHVVEEFVDVKMDRADISVALYQVAADVGGLGKTGWPADAEGRRGDASNRAGYGVATRQTCHRHDACSDVGRNALHAGGASGSNNGS